MNKGCFIKTLMALSITSMGGYQAFVVVKGGGGLCGCDRMVVGFTTYAICAYVLSSNPAHNEVCSIQHYIIKFVSCILHRFY